MGRRVLHFLTVILSWNELERSSYSARPQDTLLEIEQRAALGRTSQCSPLIHFLWGILRPGRVHLSMQNCWRTINAPPMKFDSGKYDNINKW